MGFIDIVDKLLHIEVYGKYSHENKVYHVLGEESVIPVWL